MQRRSKKAGGVGQWGGAQGPEISQDQMGGQPPQGPETHVSIIPGEMGLQVGLGLIEKNKIEQKAMTCLACRGSGESCPEETLKEHGKGEGPPSRLSKVMSRPLKARPRLLTPRGVKLWRTQTPNSFPGGLTGWRGAAEEPGSWVLTAGL